ncbi:transporter, UIT1 family [Oscillibacter sp. PC13]|uniref:SLC13 family permease n=1 Tax=Oscillibacter sp. PC13 TaxID=1855299 RepID=UPI0008EEA7E5|nr:SLC13 family permease [Oscillibacter sp. PC13]SFO98492.1 transporter, UIT1 family [Oscillibacter sp. PC13]
MSFEAISLIVLIAVFAIGAFKKNPLHIGILAMGVAFFLGKAAGLKDVAIMGFFPTTLFVRVFGILFFFAIAQANGAIELLAKKIIAKTGKNAKLMPFFIFYTGVILGSIGINSLAGMAILSGIGISLAVASGTDALLYGLAGGYGIACGCYSPINEYCVNITTACETAGLEVNLMSIYIFCLVAFSISFLVIYLLLGGYKAKGTVDAAIVANLPEFTRGQVISLIGIVAVIAVVVLLKWDIGWAGMIVAIACILLGACKCGDALKKVSLPSLILICGVGLLVNLVSELGGFTLLSSMLASIMSTHTVAPLMCLTSSVVSLFTISRLVVLTLVPTLPGILEAIPTASVALAVAATCAGAFASSIGPLSSNGALIMTNLGMQLGEETAEKSFTRLLVMGIVGGLVVALCCFVASMLGIFG